MAAVHIRFAISDIAAFALAWIALSASPGSAQQSRAPLVLLPINGGGKVVLVPERDDGGFSDEDLRRAAVAFSQQSPRHHRIQAGKVHPLAPRLLDLVYRSVRHFDAQVVRVVSGFRRDRAGSRHTQGRAVDMTIEGVANDRLAAYARDFGFVGVGVYPKSGFVHLDVRDASYFWVDDSAPGAVCHLIPGREAQARQADAAARARGEAPDVYVPNNRAEDAAAAKVYAARARQRQAAARHRIGSTPDPEPDEIEAPPRSAGAIPLIEAPPRSARATPPIEAPRKRARVRSPGSARK